MSPGPRPTLYLIDGNSYIYRAFHAIRGLSTSKGFPTNAAFGFTNMLMKVVNEKAPDYLAVCFDPKGPTARNEIYTAYKATRPPTPEGLVPQIPYIHRIVEAFNIPVLLIDGIEADDVIASVAEKAGASGLDVTVVTGDKDLFQIIGDSVRVYDTMKDAVYGPQECENKFGVPPERLTDFLGLTGDTSDNIPGVPGVGPKTAAELIKQYGTLEEVLEHADEINKPKLRENLKAHSQDALLSKRLVTLSKELPVDIDIESLRRREQDPDALMAIFKELEFGALLKHVKPGPAHGVELAVVRDKKALSRLAEEVRRAGACAMGVCASSRLPMSGSIVGVYVCCSDERAYYVPLGHVKPQGGLFPEAAAGQIPMDEALGILGPLLMDGSIKKYGHDLKSDMILLTNAGIKLGGAVFDCMVGSYLLNPGRASHTLENLALEYLGRKMTSFDDTAGSGAKAVPFAEVGIDAAAEYAAGAAHVIFGLAGILSERLRDEGLMSLFEDMELPLIGVLAGVEMNGVHVDKAYLDGLSVELGDTLDGIVRRVYALAGGEFNINSPKQLSEVLFERLGLRPVKKTKTGYSTDEEVLTTLAVSHELPAEILAYRELYKLKSTYVDALSRLVNPRTGRLHTSLNQTVTATGRLSSSEPNLQNIPVRTETGRRIRRAFTAPQGSVIVSADYSQIELRLMAHLSGDPSLTESFMRGEDVHTRTASEIFGLSPAAVTADMRRHAKAINFGIMYGMGAYGLATQIGVSPKEAARYIDAYFERHAGVRAFIEKNLEEVEKNGYSTTLFGRRRAIPELASSNRNTRALGERLAINTPIQGTAADIIKLAMITVSRRLVAEGLSSMMVLQVHDELVFEAPAAERESVMRLAVEEMENAARLDVPVKVDVGSGPNWDEAH
jgi:DNA polymerase I